MEGRVPRARSPTWNSVAELRPPVPAMALVWQTAARLKNRESDAVASADVALPFASAFAAARQ